MAAEAAEQLTAHHELLPSDPGFEAVLQLYFCSGPYPTNRDTARVTRISSASPPDGDAESHEMIQFHWSYGAVNEWPLWMLQGRIESRHLIRMLWVYGLLSGTGIVLMFTNYWIQSQHKTTQRDQEARPFAGPYWVYLAIMLMIGIALLILGFISKEN